MFSNIHAAHLDVKQVPSMILGGSFWLRRTYRACSSLAVCLWEWSSSVLRSSSMGVETLSLTAKWTAELSPFGADLAVADWPWSNEIIENPFNSQSSRGCMASGHLSFMDSWSSHSEKDQWSSRSCPSDPLWWVSRPWTTCQVQTCYDPFCATEKGQWNKTIAPLGLLAGARFCVL